MAWVHSPNPRQHCQLGLNANASRDATAVYFGENLGYQAQATVTRAIIAALNVAVPKAFECGTTIVGDALIGAAAYCSNHDPWAILLALHITCDVPSLAKPNANDVEFTAPWNTAKPIEIYFDCLDDCYVAAIIVSLPFIMEQMMTAIMAVQLTSIYSQSLTPWNDTNPAIHTWDGLNLHFTCAHIVQEQSGTESTGANGYHNAANAIINDDTLNNIESTLNNELSNLNTTNNAKHQTVLASTMELCTAIAAAQQQITLLVVMPGNVPPATAAELPSVLASNNYQRNNYLKKSTIVVIKLSF